MMGIKDMRKNLDMAVDAVSDKAKELGSFAADNAKEAGVIVADNAKVGLKAAGKKMAHAQREIKKKIYNPIFPEEYWSEGFDCPKIIVIEDEDARKGIDVCEGAIGWLSKAAGSEVLHLYEEFVSESGLVFFPFASCESVYYLNPNKEHRYINLSCYFETMQQDKFTELKNIAFCLGAKECRLESYEAEKEIILNRRSKGAKIKVRGADAELKAEAEGGFEMRKNRERRVVFSQKFEGSDSPVEPVLDWYRNDKEILSLIKMRMEGRGVNPMKEYSFSIDSKLSASMDINLAAKLDATLEKLGAESNFDLKSESQKEMRTKMEFVIVF